jgi:hypothetical protein
MGGFTSPLPLTPSWFKQTQVYFRVTFLEARNKLGVSGVEGRVILDWIFGN